MTLSIDFRQSGSHWLNTLSINYALFSHRNDYNQTHITQIHKYLQFNIITIISKTQKIIRKLKNLCNFFQIITKNEPIAYSARKCVLVH